MGFVLAFTGGRASRIVRSTLYIALGWAAVAADPADVDAHVDRRARADRGRRRALHRRRVFLLTRWPDPFPRVFGYHEVWHVMVVAAVACHFVAITSVVAPSPRLCTTTSACRTYSYTDVGRSATRRSLSSQRASARAGSRA